MAIVPRKSTRKTVGLSTKTFAERKGPEGFRVFKPEAQARHQLHSVKYKNTHTIARVLPQPEPEDETGWSAILVDNGVNVHVGSWLHSVVMASFVGENKYSFVLDRVLNPTYRSENDIPYKMLCNEAASAHKKGTAPASWIHCTPKQAQQQRNMKSILQWPETFCMVQAVLHLNESKDVEKKGLAPDDPLPILRMTDATGNTLCKLIELHENCPDFVSWIPEDPNDEGGYLGFSQVRTGPYTGRGHSKPLATTWTAFDKAEHGYDVHVYPSFFDQPAIFTEEEEDMLKAKVTPWDDVFWIPTPEEQVELLLSARFPASLMVKALDERYGSLLPSDFRKAGQRELGWGGQSQVVADLEDNPWSEPGGSDEAPSPAPASRSRASLEERRARRNQAAAQKTEEEVPETAPARRRTPSPEASTSTDYTAEAPAGLPPSRSPVAGGDRGDLEYTEADSDEEYEETEVYGQGQGSEGDVEQDIPFEPDAQSSEDDEAHAHEVGGDVLEQARKAQAARRRSKS